MWTSRRKLLLLPVISILSIFLTYSLHRRQLISRRPDRVVFAVEEESIAAKTAAALSGDDQSRYDETSKLLVQSGRTTTSRQSIATKYPFLIPTSQTYVPKSAGQKHTCKDGPVKDLMFLKTHKTGSSTVQNILVRHAYKEKLFVGLPRQSILFKYSGGYKFRKIFMQTTPPGKKVNMLMHHMVFDFREVSSVIPPNATYITILRDPATQFESVFHYLHANVKAFRRINQKHGVGEYVRHPEKYYKGSGDGNFWWFGKNNVVYDLGFNNTNETDAYIQETRKKVDSIFDLVMIAEYFDISLLLLKDLLCWNVEDMVYLSMNARNLSTVENMTEEVKQDIYKWNKADTELYRYYNDTFWKRVKEYGEPRLKADLKKLEKLKEDYATFCVEDHLVSNKELNAKNVLKMYSPPGLDITQYKLKPQAATNQTCLGMVLPEKAWYDRLARMQYPRPVRRIAYKAGVKPQVGANVPHAVAKRVGDGKVVYKFQPKNPPVSQNSGVKTVLNAPEAPLSSKLGNAEQKKS